MPKSTQLKTTKPATVPKIDMDLSSSIMARIKTDKITMKPKWYFLVGSVLAFLGLVSATVMTSFFISLISFSLRPHYGPGAAFRLQLMWASFPWWAVIFAFLGTGTGLWLLKKYDFSYKQNFWLLILGFIVSTIAAGYLMDITGLTEVLTKHGPGRGMRSMFGQYMLQEERKFQRPGWKRMLNQ